MSQTERKGRPNVVLIATPALERSPLLLLEVGHRISECPTILVPQCQMPVYHTSGALFLDQFFRSLDRGLRFAIFS